MTPTEARKRWPYLDKSNRQYLALSVLEALAIQSQRNAVRIRLKRLKSLDPLVKVRANVRSRVASFLKSKGYFKSKITESIGCTKEELKKHLECNFKEGMTWSNYGKWHIDHIIPLATGKTVEQIRTLNHFSNLQPLWAMENFRKGAKAP